LLSKIARIDYGIAISGEGISKAGSRCGVDFDARDFTIRTVISTEAATLITVIASVSAVGGGGVL
jgi:hypothetical protein